ncbi:MAG: DivIVA domain-containing protein [Candidatus Eiseniibacteriota bacterium]|jgi:cell division initiation protein
MGLTPLDVRKQQFRRVVRGVDADEVKVFLGQVAEEMERLIRTRADLEQRVSALDGQLEEYRSLDKTLRDSVVAAHGMREESRSLAEKEGQLVIRKAEQEAERILRDAEARVADLRRGLAALESDRRNYLIRLRSLIETHMKMVEAEELRAATMDGARQPAVADEPRGARASTEAGSAGPASRAAARIGRSHAAAPGHEPAVHGDPSGDLVVEVVRDPAGRRHAPAPTDAG